MRRKLLLVGTALFMFSMGAFAADKTIDPSESVAAAIADMADGDVLTLNDGVYNDGGGKVTIKFSEKAITVQAANAGQAVLSNIVFEVEGGTNGHIIFDGIVARMEGGLRTEGNYFIQINKSNNVVGDFTLKNCAFDGFGRGVLRATTSGAKIDNILVDNCVFTDTSLESSGAGYAQINAQKATVKTVVITNCTFYNSPAAIFRHAPDDAKYAAAIDVLINKCTVVNCGSTAGRRMIEMGVNTLEGSVIKVKNSIFTGSYEGTVPAEKPISLQDKGDIENCLLEGFSDPLVEGATETSPVAATVTAFDFEALTMTTAPVVGGLGDPRWNLNNGATGINSIDTDKEVIAVDYYNAAGVKLSAPVAGGITIVKETMIDGSVKTSKMYIK